MNVVNEQRAHYRILPRYLRRNTWLNICQNPEEEYLFDYLPELWTWILDWIPARTYRKKPGWLPARTVRRNTICTWLTTWKNPLTACENSEEEYFVDYVPELWGGILCRLPPSILRKITWLTTCQTSADKFLTDHLPELGGIIPVWLPGRTMRICTSQNFEKEYPADYLPELW